MAMLEYRTHGFKPYSVRYSPFFDNRLAVATAANYGIVGNGRLYLLYLSNRGFLAWRWYDTQDALFDVAHSESHSTQLVTASGDGSVRLYDTALKPEFPVSIFNEHKREVYSCSWNLASKTTFASSSWDGTVKIWNPEREQSILTMPTHSCTYSVQWSPHTDGLLSAVCTDSHLRVWDLRTPASASNHLVLQIPVHNAPIHMPRPPFNAAEVLTHDWNKYRGTVIATAGVDRIIRTFDIRQPSGPVQLLHGHQYAVRKLAWSPHQPDLLISASYDMSCRIWNDGGAGRCEAMELGRMEAHTEFCVGVDWCMFGKEGWAASCGWDEMVRVWDANDYMRNIRTGSV